MPAVNKDGHLSRKEVWDGLMREGYDRENIERRLPLLFSSLDKDGDGVITKDEFLGHLQMQMNGTVTCVVTNPYRHSRSLILIHSRPSPGASHSHAHDGCARSRSQPLARIELAQPNQDYVFSKRAAFFNGLKSKVGRIMAKATALRVNLNLAPSIPSTPRPPTRKSHAHLLYALNLSHHVLSPHGT